MSNEIIVNFEINPYLIEGYSPGELRNMRCDIPSNIPDCAVIKNGMFEWYHCEFNIDADGKIY